MVDIVLRGRDGHELTARALDSIRGNTVPGDYRLILVDDGSEPAYEARGDFQIRSERTRGAVSATNAGLALSLQLDGDYVLVMDNDTRIPEGDVGWLDRFVAELEEFGDTAAVGATTNYANRPQHILSVPQVYTGAWRGESEGVGGLGANPQVPWFVSFCVLLRKDAVRQVGLWDERYNPGNWEDTDYAVALRVAGWKVRVARSVYVHHEGHRTFGDDLRALLAENREKFVAKWGLGRLMDLGVFSPQELAAALRGAGG